MQKNSFIAYEYLTQTVSPSMQATYVVSTELGC